jgi:hypothetical protein
MMLARPCTILFFLVQLQGQERFAKAGSQLPELGATSEISYPLAPLPQRA